ncbi:MAG: hypothetical protein IPN02_14380 [Candidatus Microthrix sp.]|uniref:ATP-grasp domain-containing protein n=1 Tax=Candidatus Neomicrothrix subdominans TaxID=2954438 RepID=A0A936NE35_9ACTN|nr:hypothetical protein [Candidatus Microthrix subdominans]
MACSASRPRVSLPGEIVTGAGFCDYEDKYVTSSAELVIPAELPRGDRTGPRLALVAYRALRGADLGQVDFFYESPGGGLLLNEINTMPGFTPASMFPWLWRASGLPCTELIDELVRAWRWAPRTARSADGSQSSLPIVIAFLVGRSARRSHAAAARPDRRGALMAFATLERGRVTTGTPLLTACGTLCRWDQ